MDALAVTPASPVAFSALSALRPLALTPVQSAKAAGTATLSVQDLAQGLFQRTLQAASTFPVAQPATGSAGLAQEVTASLLASLTAPQASADTTVVPTATTNPTQIQAPEALSTAPPSAPPATVIGDLPATQDGFATSLSPDFAMQTALRFGAGVASEAALALPATDLGAGLVRDAASVLRLGNLQPHAGGPGPEAFTRAQTTLQRVLRSYEAAQTPGTTQDSRSVDLLA